MKDGYTLAELLIVMAIVLILALVSLANFVSRRNTSELTTTAAEMAGLLREAQSRSVAQSSSTSWGVHFDNGANGATPYFVLFAGQFGTSSNAGYYPLPAYVGYVTSSIPAGSYAEVTFSEISGIASGSSSIVIDLLQNPQASSTLSIASSGAVSY